MNRKQKQLTILLSFILVLCIVMTSLLLSNSIQCTSCKKSVTEKYILSVDSDPYCEKCGENYYHGWPGGADNFSVQVNNTLRNILIIAEILIFIGALVLVNKSYLKGTKKIAPPSIPDAEPKFIPSPIPEPVPAYEPAPTPKPAPAPKPAPEHVPSSDSTKKTRSAKVGNLITTFKSPSESGDIPATPSYESYKHSSDTISDNNSFKPAGDL